jgi:hypothetical protein
MGRPVAMRKVKKMLNVPDDFRNKSTTFERKAERLCGYFKVTGLIDRKKRPRKQPVKIGELLQEPSRCGMNGRYSV